MTGLDNSKQSEEVAASSGDSLVTHILHQPPTRRAAWVVICLVVLFSGCSWLAFLGYQTVLNSTVEANTPKAAVLSGTPLAWRMLAARPPGDRPIHARWSPVSTKMVIADFTGEGTDSILYLTDPESDNEWTLMAIDGEVKSTGLSSVGWFTLICAWDYQADGKYELAVSDHHSTTVYNADGSTVHMPPVTGFLITTNPAADVTGDGSQELILDSYSNINQVQIVDSGGTSSVLSSPYPPTQYVVRDTAAGDVNGDGIAEIIEWTTSHPAANGNLVAYSGAGQPITIANWPHDAKLAACLDLDGNGTDEIIDPCKGYLNPATQVFTPFKTPPAKVRPQRMYQSSGGEVAVFDVNSNSANEIVTIRNLQAPNGERLCTAILAYDLQGNLVYHEEMGETIDGLGTASSSDLEHLVVLTESRVLIYP